MTAPAFVYVAPARYEDILKIGFSHDPCDRVRSFHPRWFEYFDLERGFTLAATDEQDARRIERLFAQQLREHRTGAPLVIERAVGGVTEWYRGAHAAVVELAERVVAADGYASPVSLADSLHERLLLERDRLFERSTFLFDAIDALHGEPQALTLAAALRTLLDAYVAMRIDARAFLPAHVVEWFERPAADDPLI